MLTDRTRLVSVLQESRFLGALGSEALLDLAGRSRVQRYRSGDLIFAKGSSGDYAVVVLSGRVKIVSVSPQTGTEIILNLIDPGHVFGELALLDGQPRCADAIALTRTEVLILGRREFLGTLKQDFSAMQRLMEVLCAKVRETTAFVEGTALLDAGARLLDRLLALADRYGTRTESTHGVRIEHGLSQGQLGESVGLTRVSVNRQLAAWRQRGLIEHGKGYVLVHDARALREAVMPSGALA